MHGILHCAINIPSPLHSPVQSSSPWCQGKIYRPTPAHGAVQDKIYDLLLILGLVLVDLEVSQGVSVLGSSDDSGVRQRQLQRKYDREDGPEEVLERVLLEVLLGQVLGSERSFQHGHAGSESRGSPSGIASRRGCGR